MRQESSFPGVSFNAGWCFCLSVQLLLDSQKLSCGREAPEDANPEATTASAYCPYLRLAPRSAVGPEWGTVMLEETGEAVQKAQSYIWGTFCNAFWLCLET